MIKLLVLVFVFFALIYATPIIFDDPGYISIAMGGMIYELTIYTAIFWILFVFLILVLIFIIMRGGFRFSLGTWNKLAFASKRRGVRDFEKGIAAYIIEDYVQAEHLFAKSSEPAQQKRIGYLLAAAAASKQSLPSNTKHYLGLIDAKANTVKNSNIESVIVTIKLFVENDDIKNARALIDEHHKFIGHDNRLLSLEINLCLMEKRFLAAVESLVLARKQKDIKESTIHAWEEVAFYGAFNQLADEQDIDALSNYWNNLSTKVKRRDAVITAYCKVLAEQNIKQPINKILLPVIKKGVDKEFLQWMRTLPLTESKELLSVAQKLSQKDPTNALRLSSLGHLAVANEAWETAEAAFKALLSLDEKQYDNIDLSAYGKTLKALEKFEESTQIYAKAF